MKYLYETHMHTSPPSACARCSPAGQVRAYKERGYTGIIITDHFVNGNSACPRDLAWNEKMNFFLYGYEEARKEGGLCGLDVFFGIEYNVDGTEFLTYGLPIELLFANPGMDKWSVKQYSDFVRKHGGYLAQAHPFRVGGWIKNQFPAEPHLMDAVETYNASMPDDVNEKARRFALRHNLPMQSGSDSHDLHLPFASGIALEEKAGDIFDIIEAIKTNSAKLITP